MKGFIQRLALLIHWFGFLIFLSLPIGVITNVIAVFNGGIDLRVFLENLGSLVGMVFFFWVLKWLISGNKSIWPWQS